MEYQEKALPITNQIKHIIVIRGELSTLILLPPAHKHIRHQIIKGYWIRKEDNRAPFLSIILKEIWKMTQDSNKDFWWFQNKINIKICNHPSPHKVSPVKLLSGITR